MGKFISKLCPCFGRDRSVNEEVVRREYTETEYKEYNFNNLNNEELQTPLRYYAMRYNRGCC